MHAGELLDRTRCRSATSRTRRVSGGRPARTARTRAAPAAAPVRQGRADAVRAAGREPAALDELTGTRRRCCSGSACAIACCCWRAATSDSRMRRRTTSRCGRRASALARGVELLALQRLPGAPRRHPVPAGAGREAGVRAHAERLGLGLPRTLIAVLETYQQADGSIGCRSRRAVSGHGPDRRREQRRMTRRSGRHCWPPSLSISCSAPTSSTRSTSCGDPARVAVIHSQVYSHRAARLLPATDRRARGATRDAGQLERSRCRSSSSTRRASRVREQPAVRATLTTEGGAAPAREYAARALGAQPAATACPTWAAAPWYFGDPPILSGCAGCHGCRWVRVRC
jgi:hypothetical protein